MSQKLNPAIAIIGIDIRKNSFHLVGHDQCGAIVLRQKWSRGQVETRLANLPPCLIGMEACVDLMHDLKVERFYTSRTINGEWIHAEGPIKTFTLRGIKDSPPYLQDGRLLTLEDTVEFFNLVLGVQLTPREKAALVAFMRQP